MAVTVLGSPGTPDITVFPWNRRYLEVAAQIGGCYPTSRLLAI